MPVFSQRPDGIAELTLFGCTLQGRQSLALSLRISAATDIGLIVPVPIAPGAAESEVRLLSTDGSQSLFESLASGFSPATGRPHRRDADEEAAPRTVRYAAAQAMRAVYVPSIADFDRVAAHLRLPEAALASRPEYASYGFYVFELPAGQNVRIVPMGFDFPTRHPEAVYFPTWYGDPTWMPDEGHRDITVYTQFGERLGWEETRETATRFVNASATRGLIAPDRPVQRKILFGDGNNEDLLAALPSIA